MLYVLLFWEFCKVGLFCVGGGYASMPLIQHCVVDTYHWLSMSEFVDIFTISQMTPGQLVSMQPLLSEQRLPASAALYARR